MKEWYTGDWHVTNNKSVATDIVLGEIRKHGSGAIILRCPQCHSIQYTQSEIAGPDIAPTLLKTIQCGAGHCRRCGIFFRITGGKAAISEPEEVPEVKIPDKLKAAGVHRPINLDHIIDSIRKRQS